MRYAFSKKNKDDGDTHHDLGTLMALFGVLILACFEGTPWGYAFGGAGRASYTTHVSAQPDQVWQEMQTATSPGVALPAILRGFPQPVAVVTDEGTALGAKRVVRLAGREGQGLLSLHVTDRSKTWVRFKVLSDTSPMAAWIGFAEPSYHVQAEDQGTRLTVELRYEQKLAPAWVFAPMMRAAAWGAMGVLAEDTRARSES